MGFNTGMELREVGDVEFSGESSQGRDGVWTVLGYGKDIWGKEDEFHYLSVKTSGDLAFTVLINDFSGEDPWSKGGIMFRSSLKDKSRHYSMFLTGANGMANQYRKRLGGYTMHKQPDSSTPESVWLRVTKVGNTFQSYFKHVTEGSVWVEFGDPQEIRFNKNFYVGVAVTAHSDILNATLQTSNFEIARDCTDPTIDSEECDLSSTCEYSPVHSSCFNYGEVPQCTAGSLTSHYDGGNGQAGNMFDVKAVNDIIIHGLDIHVDVNDTVNAMVYTYAGPYASVMETPNAWTKIFEGEVHGHGVGFPTPLPDFASGVSVKAGDTRSFYVTLETSNIDYSNGDSEGAVLVQDNSIIVYQGRGVAYPFGGTYAPRTFNGMVRYTTCGGESTCVSWRQTGDCSGTGPREPQFDQACHVSIESGWSGFCECIHGEYPFDCAHDVLTCQDVCDSPPVNICETAAANAQASGWCTHTGSQLTWDIQCSGDLYFKCHDEEGSVGYLPCDPSVNMPETMQWPTGVCE
jgi:hypothetical protein